jgi:hypothetical protein
MLKIFGAITWFLGIGGLVYAASTSGSSTPGATGPEWLYSRV